MKTATFVGLCLAMFFLGWVVNDVMRIQKANAAKAIAYKVVPYNYSNSEGQLEAILNAHAKQGWRLHLTPIRHLWNEKSFSERLPTQTTEVV